MRGTHVVRPVVVANASRLLDRDTLEEVRFLLDFTMDVQSPMAPVFSAQNELWGRLDFQARSHPTTY
jgi:general secretion pathway protein A